MRSISFFCGFWQANIHAQLMWKLWMYSLSRALISQVSHKLDWPTWEGTLLSSPAYPWPLHQHTKLHRQANRVHLLSGQLQLRCWYGNYPNLCKRQLSASAPERDLSQIYMWAVNTLLKSYSRPCLSAKQLCSSDTLVRRTDFSLLCEYISYFILLLDASLCSHHRDHLSISSLLPQLEIEVCLQQFIFRLF